MIFKIKKILSKIDKKIIILPFIILIVLVTILSFDRTYSSYDTADQLSKLSNRSGVSGSTVTIDDYLVDYDYYMGQNFTENYDGTLPTGTSRNLYNDDNLVKVKITYSGTDINDSSLVGHVSLSEQQDTYVYYKYYPIIDNKINIELIDNPFSDAPNDKGFNGWVTDYYGAKLIFDKTYYTRYAEVSVNNNDPIEITFHASWVDAAVSNITSSGYNTWSNAFSKLNSNGFVGIGGDRYPVYEDVSNYYIRMTVNRNETYPDGAVNNTLEPLTGTCSPSWILGQTTCTYYVRSSSSEYDASNTYYKETTGYSWNGTYTYLTQYNVQIDHYAITPYLPINYKAGGFFLKRSISYNASFTNMYDASGNYISSGTCNTRAGCSYYEYVTYYDDNGNVNLSDGNTQYYYMVTRDTNIIVMQTNLSSTWGSIQNKPFTLTSIYNDIDYTGSVTWDVSDNYVYCYNDTRIENIKIDSGSGASVTNAPSSTYSYGYIYGNQKNLKIGRGLVRSGSNQSFNGVIGSDNSTSTQGSSNSLIKYKLIVESGFYNTITLTNGPIGTTEVYASVFGIYGNDYDKVKSTNDNLDVYFDVCGSWGGYVYSNNENTGVIFDTIVKSGRFGSSKSDHTTGIYVGGRYGGKYYAIRQIRVEGGWIYNLIGGPMANNNRSELNDVFINMTGGTVDVIVGGAGTSATYGNKILSITGGTVNYSVFGGSNGYNGSEGDGTINGSSFVYIGGDASIGNQTLIDGEETIWGAESGSVFGIGNGKANSITIGSNDNSNIIIDNRAKILRNVYGGGNYGATGISSSDNSSTTNVYIKGGTINGSVYGGGNNNGSGSSSKTSTVNIEMTEGTVKGSIYGGSKTKGTIYGDVYLDIKAGTINNSVYGGGEGGYSDSDNPGTFVTGNVNVVIGEENAGDSDPKISESVYGGSAFGTVNGSEGTTNLSSTNTHVVVNSGRITNVYGGGEGSEDYTPYVCGNTLVDINGGKIDNVFGGNDLEGTPNGSVTVNINGGTIGSAYAGGNKTEVNSPYINLNGGTIDNAFGGGNNAKVNTSNVLVNGSTVTNVFGGSNASGDVTTSNVIVNAGTVTNAFGGNNVGGTTATTNVTINGGTVTSVYGGGEKTDVTTTTNVNINSAATNVFGGSDSEGNVKNSNVNINNGSNVTNVYGGNNLGGKTVTSNVNVNAGTVVNTYGGGLKAITDNTNVIFSNGGKSENIYGGGNEGDVTGSTIVSITDSEVTNNVFGGGNAAKVLNNTSVTITNSSVLENVFGGGNNGMVIKNATTDIKDSTIGKSVYAGGNGSSAVVIGDNKLDIEDNSVIGEHVFGGGNAAATGCIENIVDSSDNVLYECTNPNSSTSIVNIAGASINGNVYGGANTSVVYGETYVNIGINTIEDSLIKSNINIAGTVFGGGEANASGSTDYDFNFISVTEGININIDGSNHNVFNINGSIFGSGNASSSGGYSYIDIKNYGTPSNPKKNISIQRTDVVTIDNSSILLSGAQDRTNKYKNELFTLSRIGHLKLKNNSTLYLERGANLLEKYSSLVDISGNEEIASVTINTNNVDVTKNVDNRIYMYEGRNLNISDDESLATFGDVNGMTFFGMFKFDRNDNITAGLYSSNYNAGDNVSGSELYYFSSGSYVVGKHKSAHDIEVDGFYSNYANDDGTGIVCNYIEPTPSDATFYRWVIGESVEVLEVNITASKYSTLGAKELQLMDYYEPNTEIYILGVNFDELSSDINILPSNEVPRYEVDAALANKNFGLGMKTGNVGWITRGETEFSTTGSDIYGTTYYKTENSNAIPSFMFYLYHSKNISETKDLGKVVISLMVVTPIDDLSNKIKRVNIEVNMDTAFYEGINYEASITPGAQYEMFANSSVNITNKSTFSAYYSLYSTSDTTIYRDGYKRSLVSNYAYPVNTKITMIDLASSEQPEYYYFIVDSNTYSNSVLDLQNDGEISYSLSNFIKMGSPSVSNTYNDAEANIKYYDSTEKKVEEEFIFIVDLKDAGINEDVLNKSLLLELRDANNNPVVPVLDISQQKMFYNLYEDKEAVINLDANLSNNILYIGQSIDLTATTTFSQQSIGNITIIDTNYYEKRLGIKLSLYNSDNEIVNGAGLLGTAFEYDGGRYYPRQDGTVRFNIAETVANVSSKIKIDAEKSNIASGQYTLVIETFGSADGIYYGVESTNRIEKAITIVNETYGLIANLPDNDVIINKDTGLSQDQNDYLDFQITYESSLNNPNIRVSMYRRTYEDIYDYDYVLVDLQDYVTNELEVSNKSKIYIVKNMPTNRFQYILNMKDNLMTGTYQIRFSLYDGDNYVGHINKYIIIE